MPTITLTDGPDTYTSRGTPFPEVTRILALGGNDMITVVDGFTTDVLLGDGDDFVLGSGGTFITVSGGNGNDRVDITSNAHLSFDGGNGDDIVNASGGQVSGTGGPGADQFNLFADMAATIWGDDGNDIFTANNHAISGYIYGGAGDDRFVAFRPSSDTVLSPPLTLEGGPGADTFIGTIAQMNGITIADFTVSDSIWFSAANYDTFNFSLSGHTLTFNGFSLTLETLPTGELHVSPLPGGRGVRMTILPGTAPPGDPRNDYNGDGRSDLLLRHNTGPLTTWLGEPDGGFISNDASAWTRLAPSWHVEGSGDFNGDGRDDLMLRHDSGPLTTWLGQADGGFFGNDENAWTRLANSWRIDATGDFDGDGADDLLLRHDTGALTTWLGQPGGNFIGNDGNAWTRLATSWHVEVAGDFNGDGRSDLLLRHDSGALTTWLGQSNGGFIGNDSNAWTRLATSWHVEGAGDFNGDGRDDLVLRHDTGALTTWLGDADGGFVGNDANAWTKVDTSWKIEGTGDFNGDGRDDMLWRHETGAITTWLGETDGGFTPNDANAWTTLATSWHVQELGLLSV